MVNIFSVYPALTSCFGAFFTLLCALLLSKEIRNISFKTVFMAISLEIGLLFCLLKTSIGDFILYELVAFTHSINAAAQQGIIFVFGALATNTAPWGFIFALHVLPLIIFFSAFISGLSFLGITDFIIRVFSLPLSFIVRTSRAETAAAIAKSFLGPTEAQLLIRDYLPTLSTAELFAIMVSGMSMIAASLFGVYMEMGAPGTHLITANLLGIPGSLLFAKIIMPDKHKQSKHEDDIGSVETPKPSTFVEAIIKGSLDGLQLVLAIGALLISFLALIELLNSIFMYAGSLLGTDELTFQSFVGYICAPWGFLTGLPTHEAFKVSELIGIKFLANEMVAFSKLSASNLSPRGLIIATYALCGFANIACMGIVLGGLGTLLPDRSSVLAQVSWRALAAATLSNLFSAYLVGIFI
ncbi:MAG: hypothetical protein K2X90_00040 [Candidatus Babeliaceae bacterium]|nr:hypothetical protein [Candidatus Babeliaceae bacterium]